MPSKFDEFLKNASPEQKEAIVNQGKVIDAKGKGTTIDDSFSPSDTKNDWTPHPKDAGKGTPEQQKNDIKEAGKNFQTKDSLASYPVRENNKPKEQEKEQDMER